MSFTIQGALNNQRCRSLMELNVERVGLLVPMAESANFFCEFGTALGIMR
jgi:hypothetical protein